MNFAQTEIDGKPVTLACVHWRSFPPRASVLEGSTPESLRASKVLDEAEYRRFKIWQSVCGLKAMDPAKCLSCPHVRTAEIQDNLPVLVTLDRSLTSPIIDRTTMELRPRFRLPSIKPKG